MTKRPVFITYKAATTTRKRGDKGTVLLSPGKSKIATIKGSRVRPFFQGIRNSAVVLGVSIGEGALAAYNR